MAGPGSCSCAVCAGGAELQYAGDASQALSSGKPVWSLDQITANLMRWDARWEAPLSIPFSFYEARPAHLANAPLYQGFVPFDAAQRLATRTALDGITDVANVKFVEVPDDGAGPATARLTYARGDWGHANATASANVDISDALLLGDAHEIHAAELSFNTQRWGGPALPGGRPFYVILHETMHALGFPHPGQYNRTGTAEITFAQHAEYSLDTAQYTVLSYFSEKNSGADFQGAFASTLMLHDIAALQAVYGPNMTTRAGDTTYGFQSNAGGVFDFAVNPRPVMSIWDAGGIDTINVSGFSQSARLDLNAGAFSDFAGMIGNFSIAFGVVIENAIGGSGADQMFGNAAANLLAGGAGNDLLRGAGGDDVLGGQDGDDRLEGGSGRDALFGDAGNDLLIGGSDNDLLMGQDGDDVAGGQEGNDQLEGGAGRDALYGDAGADLIIGGAGNDLLMGQDGDDVLGGQDGDDRLEGGAGRDALFGDAGNDFIVSGADGDLLMGQDGDDVMGGQDGADTIFGGSGADQLYGDADDDVLEGGAGGDILFGQAGADRFVFSATSDSAVAAADRIFDFDRAGGDLIDLSRIDANANAAGDQAFVFASAFSNQAGQAVLSFNSGTDTTTLRLDVNGDGQSDFDLLINGNVDSSSGFVL